MNRTHYAVGIAVSLGFLGLFAVAGCEQHMPHAFTWPSTGNTQFTHPKPPEGGYYKNWDPYADKVIVETIEETNAVRTQHLLVATVVNAEGEPLANRRVEWMLSNGGVGEIIEVDESGWRASRGYKVDNNFAVSHTANFAHTITRGNDDPADDVVIEKGQTWCVITSPIEGDSYITVYVPAIYDWNNHKVFLTRHWYDLAWRFPDSATNPVGTTHQFTTMVMKHSDGTGLPDYEVTYRIVDGPQAVFAENGANAITVMTDGTGAATVTLQQATPMAGTNTVDIDIVRPANVQCCKPGAHIATGQARKTWVAPEIGITKDAPAESTVNATFDYSIVVNNPSMVTATNVVVTDVLPDGIEYVSSTPSARAEGQHLSWSLGELAGGQQSSIAVKVRGTRPGTFENCAVVTADMNLEARDCATTRIVNAALAIEKTCPSEALICENIPFQIIVRNTGDGPATNVRIMDELPEGLQTLDGRTSMVFDAGTLEAGQAKQATYEAKASRAGTFVNNASVTADGDLTAKTSCTVNVREPVLAVTKESPEMRFVGRPIEYSITVSNTGDSPARDTVLVDRMPAGAEYVSATDNPQQASGTLTWRLGTLAPGESKTVTVVLRSNVAGTLKNDASATAVCASANASGSTDIRGIPAILLEVIDIEDPIEVGANVQYVITVTNQGSAVGTNIQIVAELPEQQDYVSSDGPTQAAADGKKVTFAPLPSLAPKAKATFRVTTKGNAAADTRFKVIMTSDQIDSPVQETEATNVY